MLIEMDKEHTDFENAAFCLKIHRKNDHRFYISHAMVVFSVMTVTDGNRIHQAKVNNIPSGFYKIIVNTKTKIIMYSDEIINGEYPDISHITSNIQNQPDFEFSVSMNKRYAITSISTIIKTIPDNKSINYKFLEDLMPYCFDVKIYVDKEMAFFVNDSKQAVIMFMIQA